MAEQTGIIFEHLFDFLDNLRAEGYELDTRQRMLLNDLFLALAAKGESFDNVTQLKTLIAPLICSSPSEQDDFYRRFERWAGMLHSKPAAVAATPVHLLSLKTPTPPINQSSAPRIPPVAQWLQALMALLTAMAGKLYQENQYITRQTTDGKPLTKNIPVKSYQQEILPVLSFKPIAHALRRRVHIPSNEVDIEKTIGKALTGNWVEMIYRQHQITPEYLILLDRKSRLDQQARFVQEVLMHLKNEGVFLHLYEFSNDPRICFPFERRDTPIRLTDLQSRHPDARLLVFGGDGEMFDPLTGELQPWLDALTYWSERAILTPNNIHHYLRTVLQAQDFVIVPMTLDGLLMLAHTFGMDNIHLPIGVDNASPPATLTEHPLLWTTRDPLPDDEIDPMLRELLGYLGDEGFYWLCACAISPKLDWDLTLYLGSALRDKQDQPLLRTASLLRLASLPWFRASYLPDWIRSVLIECLTNEEEALARGALYHLLNEDALQGQGIDLQIAPQPAFSEQVKEFLRRRQRNASKDSELHDEIYVRFLFGQKEKRRSLRLPERVRAYLDEKPVEVVQQVEIEETKPIENTLEKRLADLEKQRNARETMLADLEKSLTILKKEIISSSKFQSKVRVFICYEENDLVFAEKIYAWLQSFDWITPWISTQDVLLGTNWLREVEKAIQKADISLVLLSKEAYNKDQDYYSLRQIRQILSIAEGRPDREILYIPIFLDGINPKDYLGRDGEKLAQRQWLDFSKGSMLDHLSKIRRALELIAIKKHDFISVQEEKVVSSRIEPSVLRILNHRAETIGTGFLVSPTLAVTCASVVLRAGIDGNNRIRVQFSEELRPIFAKVSIEDLERDVVILELDTLPDGVRPLRLGRASESSHLGDNLYTFGYASAAGEQGIGGRGTFIRSNGKLVQFRMYEAEHSFSGAPLYDEERGVVIGMIQKGRDELGRNNETTFAVPSEIIWQVCPVLKPITTTLPKRDPIVEGINLLPYDYDQRTQNFLTEYLGSESKPVPFGGRDTTLSLLTEWLVGSTPYLLLTAPAGRGKSALLVHWLDSLRMRDDLALAFVPVSTRFGTNMERVFYASLAARLAFLHGDDVPMSSETSTAVYRGLVSDYISKPLANGKTLLVVLDGLDEAADWEIRAGFLPTTPPSGIRVAASARGERSDWLRRLNWDKRQAITIDLPPLTQDEVRDMLYKMGAPLDELSQDVDIVAELYRLSEGDPLLMRLYIDELWIKGKQVTRLKPKDLRDIQPGYKGYFKED